MISLKASSRQTTILSSVVVTTALGVAVLAGPSPDPAPSKIDAIFAEWDRPDSPGCALGVVRDGKLIYERGYGEANLDYGIPNSIETIFYIGSVSKQFAAASVLLLAQEGRIALDDDIRKYFPEMPAYEHKIEVRHLIHHTSGIRDIYTLMSLAGLRLADVFPDEDAIALIARQQELNFNPGDEYLYSNSGYFLMSELVERVTKTSLREYAAKKIFQPLGMTDTHFHDQTDHIFKRRAVSYQKGEKDGEFRISYLSNFNKVGAGGLYTTVPDLLKWDQNFYSAQVGGRRFLEELQTTAVLKSGEKLDYAFGLTVGEYRGLRRVGHGGSMMGFKADMQRYPDQRLSVITLCNLGNIDPGTLGRQVADLYLEEDFTEPASSPEQRSARGREAAQELPTARATQYVGEYYSGELDVSYAVNVVDGRLVVSSRIVDARLDYLGNDRFRTVPSSGLSGRLFFNFTRDSQERISGFTVEAGRVKNIRFVIR